MHIAERPPHLLHRPSVEGFAHLKGEKGSLEGAVRDPHHLAFGLWQEVEPPAVNALDTLNTDLPCPDEFLGHGRPSEGVEFDNVHPSRVGTEAVLSNLGEKKSASAQSGSTSTAETVQQQMTSIASLTGHN